MWQENKPKGFCSFRPFLNLQERCQIEDYIELIIQVVSNIVIVTGGKESWKKLVVT